MGTSDSTVPFGNDGGVHDSVNASFAATRHSSKPRAAQRQKISFLGLRFDNLSISEALERIHQYIEERTPRKICTVNVTLLMWARKNAFLHRVYDSSDITGVDGMAIYYASKLFGIPFKDSISASLLFYPLLEHADKNNLSIYLVGAAPDVIGKAAKNIATEYPGIDIAGYHHGYFDINQPDALVNDIREKSPDILFVGMSSPLKEQFIDSQLDAMNVPVNIGVGGMLDIAAGEVSFAPDWIRKLCLEWLYRLLQEPRRMWRRQVTTLVPFVFLVLQELIRERTTSFVEFLKRFSPEKNFRKKYIN